jgi:RNA polymerase sigma-70 factor (ECF subfamily)
MAEDDATLVAALKAGDDAAFERLVRANSGRMLAVASRLVGEGAEAQDVVQEAFLSAFRAIDRFEGTARLSTWLHRITVNAALMRLRSRRRHPEEPLDPWLPHFEADGHRRGPNEPWQPLDALQTKELRAQVRKRIDELPEIYRTVLLLRDIEGLENEEVAGLLGVNIGTVKTRLHRARLALRSLLDPQLRGIQS